MQPEMVRTFVDEFYRELNRQASEQDARRECATRDLAKTEREIDRVIEAIKAGVPGATIKDEMTALEARRGDLLEQLNAAPPPVPRLHPNVAAPSRCARHLTPRVAAQKRRNASVRLLRRYGLSPKTAA
jgi:hypothetical protein